MSTLILSIFVIIAIAISPVVVAFSIYIWIPRLIRSIRTKPNESWRPKPVQMKLKMENPPPPPPVKKKPSPAKKKPHSEGIKTKKADESSTSYATGTDDIMTSGILFGTGILSDNSSTDTGTTSNWDSGGSSDSFGGGDFGGGGSGGDWGSSSND